VLKGGEIATAQSYLKFRNDALHADCARVQKSQVNSCTAFIEALLVKHFSSLKRSSCQPLGDERKRRLGLLLIPKLLTQRHSRRYRTSGT
jgi:hypothetical protein